MSVHSNEEDSVTPWVGPTCYSNDLSVIVLSSNLQILDRTADALIEVHSKGEYRWKLQILRSTNLPDVVKSFNVTGNVAIDFVVIAMDTSKVFCLEWVKLTLAQIHPDLKRRRVVLVNASGLAVNAMAVDAGDMLSIQGEFDLDLLTANVYKPEDASFLARRLLTYLEVAIGVKTGIPNLNI